MGAMDLTNMIQDRTSGGLAWTRWWTNGLLKMWRIYWV